MGTSHTDQESDGDEKHSILSRRWHNAPVVIIRIINAPVIGCPLAGVRVRRHEFRRAAYIPLVHYDARAWMARSYSLYLECIALYHADQLGLVQHTHLSVCRLGAALLLHMSQQLLLIH